MSCLQCSLIERRVIKKTKKNSQVCWALQSKYWSFWTLLGTHCKRNSKESTTSIESYASETKVSRHEFQCVEKKKTPPKLDCSCVYIVVCFCFCYVWTQLGETNLFPGVFQPKKSSRCCYNLAAHFAHDVNELCRCNAIAYAQIIAADKWPLEFSAIESDSMPQDLSLVCFSAAQFRPLAPFNCPAWFQWCLMILWPAGRVCVVVGMTLPPTDGAKSKVTVYRLHTPAIH